MNRANIASVLIILVAISLGATGCGDKFWDPTQVGRFRPVPAVNVILDSLGVAEETPAAWETGEEPRPADVVAYETDYVFGPGDFVQISIFELFAEGSMFSNQFVITETGKISIPDVGVVEVAGLTETQLEEEIKQILSPNILKEPTVNVMLMQSQSRVFSILGSGIPRPGRYGIPRYDYRLSDALATAGGIGQFNVSYVYISRPITGEEALTESQVSEPGPVEAPTTEQTWPSPVAEPKDELLEVIAPMAGELVVASAEMATDDELAEAALPERLWPADFNTWGAKQSNQTTIDPQKIFAAEKNTGTTFGTEPAQVETHSTGGKGRIEWIFQDGRWIPVQVGQAAPEQVEKPAKPQLAPPTEPTAREEPTAVGWDQIGPGGVQRHVIRIPADKLLSGDPRYNIVIRSGDNIHVPVDIVGEFCIMGNVNRQGFINVTGRPMTLKMAIAAAGGLGPLAWPKRCEVVRRIGKNREEMVMVDLDKIAMGEQPDFFIKPNDLVNVGTHPTARWRAVLRNAFRSSYGFGFIYDRNFADRDYGTRRPIPNWF